MRAPTHDAMETERARVQDRLVRDQAELDLALARIVRTARANLKVGPHVARRHRTVLGVALLLGFLWGRH